MNTFHDSEDPSICLRLRETCDAPSTGIACDDCALFQHAVGAARTDSMPLDADFAERLRAVGRPDAAPPLTDRELEAYFADVERRAGHGRQAAEHLPEPGEDMDPDLDAVLDVLAEAVAEARRPRPLPEDLRRRLGRLPRRAAKARPADEIPRWIADSRWAGAACALLTAALTLLAGDASARFQELRVPARFQELQVTTQRWQSSAGSVGSALRQELGERLNALPKKTQEVSLSEWTSLGRRTEAGTSRLAHRIGEPLRDAGSRIDAWWTEQFSELPTFLDRERLQELRLFIEEVWNETASAFEPAPDDSERKDP